MDPDPDPEHWILARTVRVPYVPVSVFRICDGLHADPNPAIDTMWNRIRILA